MDNGQWTMDNGQWTMDNGQWTMDNRGDKFKFHFLSMIIKKINNLSKRRL